MNLPGGLSRNAACASRQRGMTLMVVLVMLVVITMFVMSMVRLSTTNLKVVGNMQAQRSLESAAQQAVEQKLSSITYFNDAINNTGTWPAGTNTVTSTVNGYVVNLARPVCVFSQPAEGNSATSSISPEDTQWELVTTSTDSITGASVQITQGIKMRLTAGSCP